VSIPISASIIIPAHNEGRNIANLLQSLSADIASGVRVILVANGCRDDTAVRARTFEGVEVVEINEASKVAALRFGDLLAGDDFPRLYVDADVVISPGSVAALVGQLESATARAVAPEICFDQTGASLLVRGYYEFRRRHPLTEPWRVTHLAGRRIYGTNKAGRDRFGVFPELINDDGFFDQLFSNVERRIVHEARVTTSLSRTVSEEIRRLVRVRRGNIELDAWFRETSTSRPDRENISAPSGYLLGRMARRMVRSGLVRDPSPLVGFYAICYGVISWRVAWTIRKQIRDGASVDWGAKVFSGSLPRD